MNSRGLIRPGLHFLFPEGSSWAGLQGTAWNSHGRAPPQKGKMVLLFTAHSPSQTPQQTEPQEAERPSPAESGICGGGRWLVGQSLPSIPVF